MVGFSTGFGDSFGDTWAMISAAPNAIWELPGAVGTGFSTYDSNSTSSSGDDSTTSVSHVESTTTETMTSGSTAKSRSGKDDQGRPFADSRNIEQFDRFTTELTIDYGHVIDKEGSHELPTFYDNETFEAIDYKSNAISTNSFSLTSGARNSQSQRERTTSQGYSITKNGTGRNRSFEIVFMNTDGQVGLDIAFGSYNQSSAFWLIEEETRSNNGRVDHHSKEDSSFNQTYRNYIHKFTQLLSSSPGTYVNSVSGAKTGTLTSYLDKEAYLSNYTGGQNQIHIKDGYQVGSKEDIIYQMKQVEDPGSAGGPNVVTLQPEVTVETENTFGGDFDGTGTIDAGGTVNWTSVTSESRSNGNVTPGNSDWDAGLSLEDYLGSGFGGSFAFLPVDAPQELHNLWQDDFQAPILDNLQHVDPHTAQHAGGRSNDTQFVSEQSNGNHNTNYQLNGAYQNLDPNTTIDFETPWGPLSSFKNTEETSSSEPVEEPTEGEGTEGEECDCACGEGLSPVLTAIHTYEIWDDGGTPEFPDDDVLIGYAVTEFYGEPWGNTTIYDMDGNKVEPDENGEYPTQYNAQNSDWRLINEETFGTTGGALAIGNSMSKEPKHPEYQISEMAAKITELAVKLAEFIVTGNIELEAGVSGKVSKKAVFDIIEKKLRALTIEKLVQIHHVIPKHFFNDGKFAKFFEKIGVNRDTMDNLIPLPTKEAKQAGLFGNMSGHWGNHLGSYYDDIAEKILNIETLFNKGIISKEEAAHLIKNLQISTKEGLIDGTIKLQNEEAWAVLIPFAMAGMTKEEQEIFAEAITEQLLKEVEKALTANECYLFRIQTYTGKEGILGWLGFGADLFNPIDDIATLEDVLILLTFDPTKETGEQFVERMRRIKKEIHERQFEKTVPWGPYKL